MLAGLDKRYKKENIGMEIVERLQTTNKHLTTLCVITPRYTFSSDIIPTILFSTTYFRRSLLTGFVRRIETAGFAARIVRMERISCKCADAEQRDAGILAKSIQPKLRWYCRIDHRTLTYSRNCQTVHMAHESFRAAASGTRLSTITR